MAPSPMKRKMSSPGRAAKRTRPNLIPTVVNAIAGCEGLAGDLRTLLKTTLPIVLKANKEDRHAHETDVVNQAAEALKVVQGEREQAHQAALAHQNEVISPAEEQKRKSGKQAAEDKLAASKTNVETRKAELKAAEQAEENAKAALSAATKETTDALRKATRDADAVVAAAQKEEKQASSTLAGIEKKKATLDAALENDFVQLRDGTGGKGGAKALLALGREYHLDKTLLDVFATAASKPADKRSEFETMSFNNLQKLLSAESAKLGQSIAEATPNKAAKTQAVADAEAAKASAVAAAEAAKNAAVEAAKATYDAAKAATKAAEEAEEAAKEARTEAGKELTKADAHVRHIWEDMRKACDAQDDAAAHLANLKEEVMAAFEQLKERKPEPEPAEEEPEPMDLSAPAVEAAPAPETEVAPEAEAAA